MNRELLRLGRIGISAASGLMPDGTLFELPFQDKQPDPLNIAQLNSRESHYIYLALPIRNHAISAIDSADDAKTGSARYVQEQNEIRDIFGRRADVRHVPVMLAAPRLIQGSEDLSACTVLPVCRIKERLNDGTLVLDESFIPCCSSISVSSILRDFLSEVAALIVERTRQISGRISAPEQQSVADVAEFMMLQLLNRVQPVFIHLAKCEHVHPEDLYRQLVSLCAELVTFLDDSRVAPQFVAYDHDNLTYSFHDLMLLTRQALSTVLSPRAVLIRLFPRSHGISEGVIHDKTLFGSADFVVAVKAKVPQETLFKNFVSQTKVTAPRQIRELVSIQIPGVSMKALSAAPPQLPHHAGYTYFQLDTHNAEWDEIEKVSAIAFHVSGDFPGLDIQLWAIRSKS
ncbi:type VI secretion system baseplate subunit TssK [Phytobacter massiliensis]|uniref:type VI secretion system baseplate subunit TssK n=1 Tax=Phytobacter massiliensis TaxID=1485952 RepID=UPI001EED6D39|nr:type VI secretion system baseplate subunit TssK [Phytobacter massiliensis]